jgi:hypothetical protein
MLAQALFADDEKPFDVLYNKMLVPRVRQDEN